jgi:hypothetical protein
MGAEERRKTDRVENPDGHWVLVLHDIQFQRDCRFASHVLRAVGLSMFLMYGHSPQQLRVLYVHLQVAL